MRLRPSTFVRTFVIVVWVSTIVAIFGTEKITAQNSQGSFSATLTAVAGLVQYQSNATNQWITVQDTQLISIGDQIRTGSNGFARLSTVTGIQAEIYPTSQFQLNALSLDDTNAQTFNGTQTVGTIFFSVTPSVQKQNHVQVALPTAGITVHGTQFYTFVSRDIHAAVIGDEGTVEVRSANQQYTITANDFLYMQLRPSDLLLTVCTTKLISNTLVTLIISPLSDRTSKIQGIRDFLHDFAVSNLNPLARTFLRQLLGLPIPDFGNLTPAQDQAAFDETLKAIDTLDASKSKLSDFLTQFRNYQGSTYKGSLNAPVAPVTCGNGKQDPGESAQNCPDDFTAPASCGNNICETNRQGNTHESLISCPADCAPGLALAKSCAEFVIAPPPIVPPIGGTRAATAPAVPTTAVPPIPNPSGVGNGK